MAQYRDLLINIGQPRDCPELREKIRRLRRNCVETCRHTSQLILPQVRRYGTSYDFFPLFLFPRFLFQNVERKAKEKRKIFFTVLDTVFQIGVKFPRKNRRIDEPLNLLISEWSGERERERERGQKLKLTSQKEIKKKGEKGKPNDWLTSLCQLLGINH